MPDRQLVSSPSPSPSSQLAAAAAAGPMQPALLRPTSSRNEEALPTAFGDVVVGSSQDSVIPVPGTARADVDFYTARLQDSIMRERKTFDQFQDIWRQQKQGLENEVQYWRKLAEQKPKVQAPSSSTGVLSDPRTPDEAEHDRQLISSLRQQLGQYKSALAKNVKSCRPNNEDDDDDDDNDGGATSDKILLRVQLAAFETQLTLLRQQLEDARFTIADLERQVAVKEAERTKAANAFNAAKAKRQADLEVIKKWKTELQRRDLYQSHQQRTINSLKAQVKQLLKRQQTAGHADVAENHDNQGAEAAVAIKQEPQSHERDLVAAQTRQFNVWRDHVRSASEPTDDRSSKSLNHATSTPYGTVRIKVEKPDGLGGQSLARYEDKENGPDHQPAPKKTPRTVSALTEDAMDDDYLGREAQPAENGLLRPSQQSNGSQRTPLQDASQTLNHLLAEPAASLPSLDSTVLTTRIRAAKSLSTTTSSTSASAILPKSAAKRPRSQSPAKRTDTSITDQSLSTGHKSRARILSSETTVASSSPSGRLEARTPLISDEVARENKGRHRYSSSMQKPPGEREWTLEDFVINPNYNHNIDYAFHDVVRGRERNCVHGKDCRDCGAFYKLVGPVTPLPSGPKWNDNSPATPSRADKGTPGGDEAVRKLIATASRHRSLWERPQSPVGFWRSEFPNTQEEIEEKREARRRYQEKVQERYEEALKNGKYLFKDKAFRPMQAPPPPI
ncbi:hypothetical protein V1525DRAFT_401799 [Lipomyces kononenkoae]|uniref:Uncharacterized protein n=1 Tax=Lipomyces kononenkoae TaxID=34357 RepID=A0ACC3T5S2_LIPKO